MNRKAFLKLLGAGVIGSVIGFPEIAFAETEKPFRYYEEAGTRTGRNTSIFIDGVKQHGVQSVKIEGKALELQTFEELPWGFRRISFESPTRTVVGKRASSTGYGKNFATGTHIYSYTLKDVRNY